MEPACRMCASGDAAPHHEEAGHRYFKCRGCGFVFLHPGLTAAELEKLYQEEAGATFHHGAEIAASHEKDHEARLRLQVVGSILATAPEKSALEIGCSAGYLLSRLRDQGWQVAGTEMSDDYIRYARETMKLEVGRTPPDRRFGAVLLFNVLSHLPDPERDLAALRARLVPGGVLVLETGNAAEVAPERVGHFGAPEHLWHFSEPTLHSMLGRIGFRDIVVRRFNVEWQRGMIRKLGALRGPSHGIAPAEAGAPTGRAGPSTALRASLKRRMANRFLLWLRFGMGRLRANPDHFCTLFVTARV